MKRLYTFFVMLMLPIVGFAGSIGSIHRTLRPVPGEYIVLLSPSAGSSNTIAAEVATARKVRIISVYGNGLSGFAFAGPETVAEELTHDPRVSLVEENARGELLQVQPASPPGWGLDRINQALLPLDLYGGPDCVAGGGIRVYVMDSGVNDPMGTEFGSRLIDLYTWDVGHYRDESSHGTAVASIVGGSHYGMARGATIINVRIANASGGINTSYALAGIDAINSDHALAQNAGLPAVVNMSFIFSGGSLAFDNAVLASIGSGGGASPNGLTYVTSAANSGVDACGAGSPARLGSPYSAYNPNPYSTITVGATMLLGPDEGRNWNIDERANRPNDAFPWSSNIGPCVDIFAPGYKVDALQYLTGDTVPEDGTSMSAPYVAGEVARQLSVNGTFTSIQVETQLKNIATQNVISDAGTGSPNLLLRTGAYRCHACCGPEEVF